MRPILQSKNSSMIFLFLFFPTLLLATCTDVLLLLELLKTCTSTSPFVAEIKRKGGRGWRTMDGRECIDPSRNRMQRWAAGAAGWGLATLGQTIGRHVGAHAARDAEDRHQRPALVVGSHGGGGVPTA